HSIPESGVNVNLKLLPNIQSALGCQLNGGPDAAAARWDIPPFPRSSHKQRFTVYCNVILGIYARLRLLACFHGYYYRHNNSRMIVDSSSASYTHYYKISTLNTRICIVTELINKIELDRSK
ncbi:MAG: hypothetical protein WBE61_05175, partial [Nitrososphaeraceae archaeon]